MRIGERERETYAKPKYLGFAYWPRTALLNCFVKFISQSEFCVNVTVPVKIVDVKYV